MTFHETRFPTGISFGSSGGPRRRTTVVTAGSGYENRNQQWADSRREYNAGYGVKSNRDVYRVVEFFEERRGKLHGFRWKDPFDWKSQGPLDTTQASDQAIGTGDGSTTQFQLKKTYGNSFNPYVRTIHKPVEGTVKVALGGVEQTSGWSVDTTTGIITFSSAPANDVGITAGYEFDVPVRFDTDFLEIDLTSFKAGTIPSIPLVELRL